MALNKELLNILVCPECKGDLELTDRKSTRLNSSHYS